MTTEPRRNVLFLLGSAALVAIAADTPEKKDKQPDPFVDRVVSFEPGEGAGLNKDKTEVVLGPPRGLGLLRASDHVVSLGQNGEITLEFVDNECVDEEGPDLLIFENPFLKSPGDDPTVGFFELGKVAVSEDGKTWKEFPYDEFTRKGCAGWHPVLANSEENDISPVDPKKAGGDPFDLKDVGLKRIRFVRITDLGNVGGDDGTTGFDLDAVAAVHSRPRKPD